MAIDDLPLPVVNLLNIIGVPWPYLNEDTVWSFAGFVRAFRQALIRTHQEATQAVSEISRAHKGASTEPMVSGWAKLSAQHVDEIADGCTVLADALDAAGVYIVAQKGVAIAELVVMAEAFFADQVAAAATFGLAEAGVPLIIGAARVLAKTLVETVTQYLAGEVIEKAAKPLFAKVSAALAGLDWSQSGVKPGKTAGFEVNPAVVGTQLLVLRGQAAQMRSAAAGLAEQVRGLKF
jgi:hypothetical protein